MSKTRLRSADYSINEICKLSSYKSYTSIYDFKVMLKKSIRDLHKLGYKVGNIKGLKTKHVFRLVELWQEEQKSSATIKNYLSKFRELGNILSNDRLVKPDNKPYGLEKRKYYPTENKAIFNPDLTKCTDPLIRLSIEGQYLFGLRREEAIKFNLKKASLGDSNHLTLSPSWTKGGIGRMIPIRTKEQREWIEKVRKNVNFGSSLIPENRSYVEQLSKYSYQIELMGLSKLHGLRHAYAQNRYHELTSFYDLNKKGWKSPVNGGKKQNMMSQEERNIDFKVRNILTREMGHSRLAILKTYLG